MTHGGNYKPRRPINLHCFICSEVFTATRPDAKFCTPTCRQQYSRASRLVKAVQKKHQTTKGKP